MHQSFTSFTVGASVGPGVGDFGDTVTHCDMLPGSTGGHNIGAFERSNAVGVIGGDPVLCDAGDLVKSMLVGRSGD